jgi:hypothetical protein
MLRSTYKPARLRHVYVDGAVPVFPRELGDRIGMIVKPPRTVARCA